MNAYLPALGCGIATESLLVGLMMLGGFGPCGPASPWGMIIYFLHAPGLFLFDCLQLHGAGPEVMTFILYAGVWSALWCLFWRRKLRQRH